MLYHFNIYIMYIHISRLHPQHCSRVFNFILFYCSHTEFTHCHSTFNRIINIPHFTIYAYIFIYFIIFTQPPFSSRASEMNAFNIQNCLLCDICRYIYVSAAQKQPAKRQQTVMLRMFFSSLCSTLSLSLSLSLTIVEKYFFSPFATR
jgi:hypothetical protein